MTMAQADVHVSENLVKRLESRVNVSEGWFGCLLGLADSNDIIHVVGATSGENGTVNQLWDSLMKSQEIVQGVSPVGIWCKMKQGHDPPVIEQMWEKIIPNAVKKLFTGQRCIIWPIGSPEVQDNQSRLRSDQSDPCIFMYNVEDKVLSSCNVIKDSDTVLDTSLLIRLRSGHRLQFKIGDNEGETCANINKSLSDVEEKLSSESVTFHIPNSLILFSRTLPSGDDQGGPCQNLLDHISDGGTQGSKKALKTQSVIDVELLFKSTGSDADMSVDCAPVIQHNHGNCRYIQVPLSLDVAFTVLPGKTFEDIRPMLLEAAVSQLKLMGQLLLKFRENGNFCIPKTYHFKPSCSSLIHTMVYPDGVNEEDLVTMRETVQHLMVLPTDRPLLRKSVAFKFPNDQVDAYLTNTHKGLHASGVEGGRVYMTEGTYAYHHYMQDRFNDNQWGCAYRSLQTLVSWLRYQGYTPKPVPTHNQIQQALVELGDKEKSFIGSRQWIGSTEVSYVLDHMFNVSSKILFVSSGAEMPTKARELALHFTQHGSPVMIGGGVLAHTILGIDFNEITGDVKWLILDPHYTGVEDLKIIQDKGWCGWKGPSFWDQNAYYNMCLPQRPKII